MKFTLNYNDPDVYEDFERSKSMVEEVGQVLANARAEAGYSQEEYAAAGSMSVAEIQALESGVSPRMALWADQSVMLQRIVWGNCPIDRTPPLPLRKLQPCDFVWGEER